jgi:very-short-patch-repair endonuclease
MPPRRTTPKGYEKARELRKELTPTERKLWVYLRGDNLGVNFRRQHAIGNYITDFCSPKAKLIIELDGSQHLDQEEYDEERTKYFQSLGYRVIRFWNNQITNEIENVILVIMDAIHPHPSSPKFKNRNLGNDENPPVEFGGGVTK